MEVQTSLEAAPSCFDDAPRYCEFVGKVILHRDRGRIPDPNLRRRFLEALTLQAANDDPLFRLDYWRPSLSSRRPA